MAPPDRYTGRPDLGVERFEAAAEFARKRVRENREEYVEEFPTGTSDDLVYGSTGPGGWTASFWTGLLWLAYEQTGDQRYRMVATRSSAVLADRLQGGERPPQTHDLGFLYTLSAVAGHRLTDSETAATVAVEAADALADRFWPSAGVIQAWGDPAVPDERPWAQGRAIVDTMMNLPLLYWATEHTGVERYRAVATEHAHTTADHLVRADGSTFHTYKFDTASGDPIAGETRQGYADDSTWARGQAWALYGFALSYRYTGERRFRETARAVADHYLAGVEADHVPRWDFDAPEEHDHRDTSAAAIAACGLAELAGAVPPGDPAGRAYGNAALATLDSLGAGYTTEGAESNGVLEAATRNWNKGNYGECAIYGDYFYLEGLTRATSDWEPYW